MKGSEIIVEILICLGVRNIFGYPGGYVLDIYEALRKRKDKINHILTASEQGAVFCADGYARSSGNAGVVLTTSGPGATNIVTGIANANMDSIPLLAITGNVPLSALGSDSFQEVDITGVTMPITKYNIIIKNIETLAAELIKAYYIAISGRMGAVLVDIPQNIQQEEYDISADEISELISKAKPKEKKYDFDIKSAVSLINSSEKTAILCGGGINTSQSYFETEDFANHLNCPVITTLMGVNTYPANDRKYFGLSGAFGNPTANHIIKTSDTIITLGARFGDRLTKSGGFDNKNIVQIDIDIAEHDKNIESVAFLHGNIKDILPKLKNNVHRKSNDFIELMERYRMKHGSGDNNRKYRNLFKDISEIIGDEAIVATDVGEHQMLTVKHFCFGRNFLTSGGLGAMGFGLGAIIGANVAKRPQKSLLITGDGSFNMSFNELITAVRLKLPLIILILNNGSLGMCRTTQLKDYGNTYMTTDLTNPDYTLLAKSMEAYGAVCRDNYALKKILANYGYDKPLIIDYIIN